MPKGKQTVLIVDDHSLVRRGLSRLVEDHPATGVVIESGSGEHALDCVIRQRVDLVLLDLSLPGMDGSDTAQAMLQHQPGIKIIILTGTDAGHQIKPLFRYGISAFLTKGCSSEEMHRAIDHVLEGEQFVSSDAARHLAVAEKSADTTSPFAKLSRREPEVVQLLLDGTTNRQIAKTLYISEKTVSTHRQKSLEKLGINSTAELVKLAIEFGVSGASN